MIQVFYLNLEEFLILVSFMESPSYIVMRYLCARKCENKLFHVFTFTSC